MEAFIKKFEEHSKHPSIIWNDKSFNYDDLIKKINLAKEFLRTKKINEGEVISLRGDFTPNAVALMFALIDNKNIIVPINFFIKNTEYIKYEIAAVQKE